MGLNIKTLTTIFFGIGVSILAISCLTVTIIFSRYANSLSTYEKYKAKLSFDSHSSLIDLSIAISVFGCISAASALCAMILSIIIEGKTLILIIIGGISSFFAFGCIISEGIYTQESFSYAIHDNDLRSYSHRGARNYVKKSIKELYEQGRENLYSAHSDDFKDNDIYIPTWSEVDKKLGTLDAYGNVITYYDLWPNSQSQTNDDIPCLYMNYQDDCIYIKYDKYKTQVATLRFRTQFTNKRTLHACWYNKDNTSLSCKNFEVETVKNETDVSCSDLVDDDFELISEKIVVGDYYSNLKAYRNVVIANYLLEDIHFAFKTLSFR